jgi:hypothetical protein
MRVYESMGNNILTPSLNMSKILLLIATNWPKFVDPVSRKIGTAANVALPVIAQKNMSKYRREL